MEQLLLLEKKWRKLSRYRWLFSFVPFLDFVLVAGSLVFGKVHENSDFDVIVGARAGRIFTVRFFCFLIFSLVGIRRNKFDKNESLRDKICLNHFVTPKSYAFRHEQNLYSRGLYENLAPFFGNKEKIEFFFKANADLIKNPAHSWKRWQKANFNFLRFILEIILQNSLGDLTEKILKIIQVSRIERNLKLYGPGPMPRLRYDSEELEFHPDISKEKLSKLYPQ